MLAPFALAVVAVAVLVTSFISGIFGMAGGMILLGVLLVFMDVAPAMVLFGVIQMASNGWRAALWWRYVDWGIVWRFLVGSTLMFLADALDRRCCPARRRSISRSGCCRSPPICCPSGLEPRHHAAGRALRARAPSSSCCSCWRAPPATSSTCSFSGATLDRKTIVATKAVTQVTGHVYRIVYFGSFAAAFDDSIAVVGLRRSPSPCRCAGTSLAALVLMRMTDDGFRMWSRRVTIGVSVTYLARGFWLVAVP